MEDLSNLYEMHIRSEIKNLRDLQTIEKLTKVNQPGYSFTYLLQPPLNLYTNELNAFARELAKKFPSLRIIWDQLPSWVKNRVLAFLKVLLKVRKKFG
jgi:hypothetical protein